MKTKQGFNLRTVCGEHIIVAQGIKNIDFSKIISMNESSAYLWQRAQEAEEFTVEGLAQWLTDEYEVDEATALADAQTVARQCVDAGIVEC